MLQRKIDQKPWTGQHLNPAQCKPPASAAMKQVVLDGQHVHRLNIAMPGVFMRMHNIKPLGSRSARAVTGNPPGGCCKPQLVNPSRPAQRHLDVVVSHTWPLVRNRLGKHMYVVFCSELLNQGNCVALGPTCSRRKRAGKHRDAQTP